MLTRSQAIKKFPALHKFVKTLEEIEGGWECDGWWAIQPTLLTTLDKKCAKLTSRQRMQILAPDDNEKTDAMCKRLKVEDLQLWVCQVYDPKTEQARAMEIAARKK